LNQEGAKASAAGAAFEAHSADCTDPRLENNSNQNTIASRENGPRTDSGGHRA